MDTMTHREITTAWTRAGLRRRDCTASPDRRGQPRDAQRDPDRLWRRGSRDTDDRYDRDGGDECGQTNRRADDRKCGRDQRDCRDDGQRNDGQ